MEPKKIRNRRVLTANRFRAALVQQFVLFTLLPCVLVVLGIGYAAFYARPTIVDAAIFVGMWFITGGLGISVGFHRLLTHRSFKTFPTVETVLAIFGSMAGNGPVLYWVAVHRRHHQHSDGPHDPHTPCDEHGQCQSIAGLIRAHIGWTFENEIPNPNVYAKDLKKKPWIQWVNNHYLVIAVIGLIIPAIISFVLRPSPAHLISGFFYGGLLRLVVGNQLIWAVNSLCHAFGYRRHETHDSSTNNWVLAVPTFGEALHNNHHAIPSSARFGTRWWEAITDSGYWSICLLEKAGWAWDVRTTNHAHKTQN
ncbi:MAG: acyl-CoA desaturase [Aureliella sp.]